MKRIMISLIWPEAIDELACGLLTKVKHIEYDANTEDL